VIDQRVDVGDLFTGQVAAPSGLCNKALDCH
jgi:hypothetical protein